MKASFDWGVVGTGGVGAHAFLTHMRGKVYCCAIQLLFLINIATSCLTEMWTNPIPRPTTSHLMGGISG